MFNLSSILNPEANRNKSESAPNSEAPTVNGEGNKEKEVPAQQRNSYTIYEHEPHPDCPDTLACLPDTDGRPQHTLPVILRCSILGSPRKRLTIREIYSAMEEKYPFYKSAGPTWKQSVRHHLSLNRLFERQPRPVTDPGFGSYWTVNLTAPPGTKRPRKRGRNNKDAPTASGEQSTKSSTNDSGAVASTSTASASETPPQPARKRGRPRKLSVSTVPRDATPVSFSHGDDDGNYSMNGPPDSDDDWESRDNENGPSPFGRRESLAGLPSYRHGRGVPFVSPHHQIDKDTETAEVTIERLRDEVGNLRRQSAEAVSVSLRLSEQLAQAQAEVSRSRNEIRDLEDALEDEQTRRREAERLASEEVKRRRRVDEVLEAGANAPTRSPGRSHAV